MPVSGGAARWGMLAIVAWILVGSSPASAYTVKQTGSGATVRWHAPEVALRIDPSMVEFFGDLPVRQLVVDAASAWHDLDGVPELFINAGEPGEAGFDEGKGASNGVYLIEEWVLAESSLAVTVATFESQTGRIVDTDVLVNANHPFSTNEHAEGDAQGFDLAGVMTHEMGHVLGLGESFDVRMATMWPNIARGEIHQRDLDIDDEAGAQEAYRGETLVETQPEAISACSKASIVQPRTAATKSAASWFFAGLALVALGLWLRRQRDGQGRQGLLALALLFAVSPPRVESNTDHERVSVLKTLALRHRPVDERRAGLGQASLSASTAVRMAAAAVLERVGTRDDTGLATQLALDADPEVRAHGARVLEALRTAPPAARVAATSPEAKTRLLAFFAGSTQRVEGEVVQVGAELRGGLIWSKFLVHDKDHMISVDIPGGTLGGYTQVISEQEAPRDGGRIVVALRERGPHAWAHVRDGVVYGGFLGEGPAIEWHGDILDAP